MNDRYRVEVRHGELASLAYVVEIEGGAPLRSYSTVQYGAKFREVAKEECRAMNERARNPGAVPSAVEKFKAKQKERDFCIGRRARKKHERRTPKPPREFVKTGAFPTRRGPALEHLLEEERWNRIRRCAHDFRNELVGDELVEKCQRCGVPKGELEKGRP